MSSGALILASRESQEKEAAGPSQSRRGVTWWVSEVAAHLLSCVPAPQGKVRQ